MLDILIGSWNQLHDPIKGWWNKLTDDDLKKIDGNYDTLVSVIQTKYGVSPQQAKTQVNQHLREFERGHRA
jgi:uncharacterized protein YjbJ (UPF0337 family)